MAENLREQLISAWKLVSYRKYPWMVRTRSSPLGINRAA